VALHARKSHASIKTWRTSRPEAPLVVALTGTDLYRDLSRSAAARESLALATRLVVLQPDAFLALPRSARRKARPILQSAKAPPKSFPKRKDTFDVCVVGHLRPVKDPFRAALAARCLPATSRIRILHVGAALSPSLEHRARTEEARNPRYHWLGELSRGKAIRVLARTRLLALTSRMEGGANVVSEAIACGVPIVSSLISGSTGILGRNYPGYFRVGDTAGLAQLLHRVEADRHFSSELARRCRALRPLVHPRRERAAWRNLLRELA
jgi:putative glycosyltransferase (TIGR04348 family)